MNVLVVYDTKFGNTERIARSIARGFGPSSQVRVEPASDVEQVDPSLDLMIVGGPTQGHGASKPMQAFLDRLPELPGTRVSAFDTRFDKPRWMTGAASGVIAERLRKLGAKVVQPGESFFISHSEGPLAPGEEDRAARWGATLASLS